MAGNKDWLLKVLTGPHVGSEAILSPGVYVLGKDDNCDIILHDTSLVAQHFQLTLDADKIVLNILSKDHPCYLDGEEIDSDSAIEIKPYNVISSGTFFFTLGAVDETWPPIELLGVGRNFKKVNEQSTREEITKEATESNGVQSYSPILMAWKQLWGDHRSTNRAYLSVGIALIGIGISLLLIVLTTSDVPRKNLTTKETEINQLIETYVVDATLQTTFVDGQKMLYIQGYTKTKEQRDAFMEALAKAGISVQIQLYSSEKLQYAISVILEQSIDPSSDQVVVSALTGFPGKVVLSGYVESRDVWEYVLDTIKTDVPGLQGYDDKVRTMDDAEHALGQMLAKQNLSDKVDINRVEHTIYLSSHALNEAEQQKLTSISDDFREHFGNQPQLAYHEQGDPPIKRFGLDIAVQSISFGTSPYLETEDGKRYTIGATIDGGYTIKEINREFILLLKEGELGRFYFAAKP